MSCEWKELFGTQVPKLQFKGCGDGMKGREMGWGRLWLVGKGMQMVVASKGMQMQKVVAGKEMQKVVAGKGMQKIVTRQ
ncbi:hypothetical protein HHK36_009865 [Tetracentron sinense]|uniref:Uncharacterized protein n=1 Tax=Tetracentron sinense TaxID=13715 RepID=A0A834ZFY9_TETSI|nr:hypothetical protein HHK36_009865 [Tetracentron sinense]